MSKWDDWQDHKYYLMDVMRTSSPVLWKSGIFLWRGVISNKKRRWRGQAEMLRFRRSPEPRPAVVWKDDCGPFFYLISFQKAVESDPKTFRLTKVKTTDPLGAALQDLSYTYDSVGNILSITDAVNTASQTFTGFFFTKSCCVSQYLDDCSLINCCFREQSSINTTRWTA